MSEGQDHKERAHRARTKKKRAAQVLALCFMGGVGGVCGLFIGRFLKGAGAEGILALTLMFGAFIAVLYLHVILHEAGHLLAGLLTGYRFVSFRVGGFMWAKTPEGIRFRRFSLAGTSGQCLMAPPEMKDGTIPTFAYNMGGAAMNLLVASVCVIPALTLPTESSVFVAFPIMSVIGFAFALLNGIPLRLGAVDNDGFNAFALRKEALAAHAFYVQLAVNERQTMGVRLRDMPAEWFREPPDSAMKNSLTAVLGLLRLSWLLDRGETDEARALAERIAALDTGLAGLHRRLLTNDRLYLELVGENRAACVDALLCPEQGRFMKAMKSYPSVLRTQYAHALLAARDAAKAAPFRAAFEKTARLFPFPGDIEGERELMAEAERAAETVLKAQ